MKIILLIFSVLIAVKANSVVPNETELRETARYMSRKLTSIIKSIREIRSDADLTITGKLSNNPILNKIMINIFEKPLDECNYDFSINFSKLVRELREQFLTEAALETKGPSDAYGSFADKIFNLRLKQLKQEDDLVKVCISKPDECMLTQKYRKGIDELNEFYLRFSVKANTKIVTSKYFESSELDQKIKKIFSSVSLCLSS